MALLSEVKTVQPDSQQIWAESALLSGVKTVHPDSQQIWAVSSLSSGVKTVQPDSLQPVGFKTNSVLVLKLCSQRLPVCPPVECACQCGSIGIGPIFIWLCGTMFCGIAGAWHHLLKGWPPLGCGCRRWGYFLLLQMLAFPAGGRWGYFLLFQMLAFPAVSSTVAIGGGQCPLLRAGKHLQAEASRL